MSIFEKLAEIVGAADVSGEASVLDGYARDMSFTPAVQPAAVVRPGNADEVQKIVKLAREMRTPLVPVSSGPPHFKGDTVPGAEGAVIVDLSGLKKIIRVDRLNRVAMFEPGVTFGELIPAVAKEGLRLNLPLLPRKNKSVVGSLLEREPVIIPKYHWDIADPLSSLEVIFGTGDRFRTGSAAGPGTIEEQWAAGGAQKEAAGPSAASWYRVIQGAQGTMGIVPWASARCEILPSLEEPFLVGAAQLDKILDLAYWLLRLRLVNECFVMNNTGLAAVTADKTPRESLPEWILFFNVAAYEYLPQERLNGQVADIREIARRLGPEPVHLMGKIAAKKLLAAVQAPPEEPCWKLRPRGGCHDIFFLALYDKIPPLIDSMRRAADENGYPAEEMGIYLQPIVQGVNCHVEFNLFYDPASREAAERVRKIAAGATGRLPAKGAFFSRPYGESAAIFSRDAATAAALKKVKAIVDPANIMNPGRLCF